MRASRKCIERTVEIVASVRESAPLISHNALREVRVKHDKTIELLHWEPISVIYNACFQIEKRAFLILLEWNQSLIETNWRNLMFLMEIESSGVPESKVNQGFRSIKDGQQ